jgi:hypothetical protein
VAAQCIEAVSRSAARAGGRQRPPVTRRWRLGGCRFCHPATVMILPPLDVAGKGRITRHLHCHLTLSTSTPRQGLAFQSVWALSAGRPGHFNARYIYQKRCSGRGPFPEPDGAMIAVE